jgi:hypothetical protein
VHYDTCYEYSNSNKSFVFNCTPIIYDINDKPLRESNSQEYYEHSDYWRASIAFQIPEEVSIFNSYNINALRWEYEIWFTNISITDFITKYDSMAPVNIIIKK